MTKKQFEKKLGELIGGLERYIREKAEGFIESGAVDMEKFGNDYVLPKIILNIALEDAAVDYRPPHGRCKEEAENLIHF